MKQDFNGSFNAQCQEQSVPVSLLALVAMMLFGPNIMTLSNYASMPQPALTISQLIMYSSLVRQKETTTSITRHNKQR